LRREVRAVLARKFELVINLETANALGSPTSIAAADE
jgi:hypothetical protein